MVPFLIQMRNKVRRTVTPLLLGLAMAVHAQGHAQGGLPSRQFYVDSANGRDDHSGIRPDDAWQTLAKVNGTVFQPGDHIFLRAGSAWKGQLWPKGSGTPGHPILLSGYGRGARPRIEGAGLVEDAVLLKNQEYWEISELEITNTGSGEAVRRGVHVATENFGEARHIYLRSLFVHDVNGTDDMKENGGIIYTSNGDSKPSRFVDLRIANNRLERVDRNGIMGWSTHWGRQKWYPSLKVVIAGNRLENIGGDGIVVVATDGALVEKNIVGHANQRSKGNNVAIWAWSADNTIIQNNEAFATKGKHDSEGFDSDWNSRNTIIQYNYSHDNEGGFVLVCNDGSVGPEYNIGNTGTIVRYNISRNDHRKIVNFAGPTANTLIHNNTIYLDKTEKGSLLVFSDWSGWASDTKFYNNIFYSGGDFVFASSLFVTPEESYEFSPGYGGSTGNSFDSNMYFSMKVPEDVHALTSDPMFTAAAEQSKDHLSLPAFRLKRGSPAINSGKEIPNNGGKDFFGTKVPSCGSPDRGAIETNSCGNSK